MIGSKQNTVYMLLSPICYLGLKVLYIMLLHEIIIFLYYTLYVLLEKIKIFDKISNDAWMA